MTTEGEKKKGEDNKWDGEKKREKVSCLTLTTVSHGV